MKKILTIIFAFGAVFFAPYVVMKIYQWHVQPLFNLVDIGYWQMFALRLFWLMFQGKYDEETEDEFAVIKIWIWLLAGLFIGWILL